MTTHHKTEIRIDVASLTSWVAYAGNHHGVVVYKSWEDDYAADYFEKGSKGAGFALHTVFSPPEGTEYEFKDPDTVEDPMIRSKGIIRTGTHWRHVCNSDYTLRLPVCEGYMKRILDYFPEAYRGAIWDMSPGFKFIPHVDFPNGDTYRMHIVLWTNKQAMFKIGGDEFHMPADGHLWMINTGDHEHTAWNFGETNRCHIHWQMPMETWDKYAGQRWILA
jgi:hypothetical protein